MQEKDSQYLAETAQCKRIAALLCAGYTRNKIHKEMGYPIREVNRLVNDPRTEKFIREIGDTVITTAKATLRQEVSLLVPMIVDVIKKELKRNNLNAVGHALRILGIDEKEAQANSSIVVNLPGQPQAIPVESREVNHEVQNGQTTEGISGVRDPQSEATAITNDDGPVYDDGTGQGDNTN